MRLSKKLITIGVLCVVVLSATLGGFAIANADDESPDQTTQETALTTLLDKVAEIYQQNTGTALDTAELQRAFTEAGAAIKSEAIEQRLQALVDEGKITQEQADAWKAWWNTRPDNALTDEFQSWLESRPDTPGFFGDNRGIMRFGGMHRAFNSGGGFGFRHCFPGVDDD